MTDTDDLLASARNAAAAGNALVARGYLRRASRVAPERLDVWRELLRVTEQQEDRVRCLERIVALDPADAEAADALAQLRAEIAAGDPATAQIVADGAGPVAHVPELGASEGAPARASSPAAGGELPAPALLAVRADVTPEMQREWDRAAAAGEALHCIDHPQRQTALRCNRCGAPVCPSCIVRTPVGYRCRACIKAQQAAFYTARWYDLPVAILLSLVMSVPAAVLATVAGWWFAIVISPVAGALIAGIVHRAVGRRHGRWTWLAVAIGVVVGALAAFSITVFFRSYNLLAIGIYAVAATGSAVGVLRLGRAR